MGNFKRKFAERHNYRHRPEGSMPNTFVHCIFAESTSALIYVKTSHEKNVKHNCVIYHWDSMWNEYPSSCVRILPHSLCICQLLFKIFYTNNNIELNRSGKTTIFCIRRLVACSADFFVRNDR